MDRHKVVVGRTKILGALDRFLDAMVDGSAALILEGDAGIGKTVLWRAACERARSRKFTVLACQPVNSETRVALAGLSDLFSSISSDVFAETPEPQRTALAGALSREFEAVMERVDSLALNLGVVTTLRRLSRATPVLIAIDDMHWLDRATVDIVLFAMRRVEGSPVGLLVTTRPNAVGPREIERNFEGPTSVISVGPVSPDSLGQIIRERTGLILRAPDVRRIHRACSGNPFFGLEIARIIASQPAGSRSLDRLPFPRDVAAALEVRLSRFPEETQRALAAASILSPAKVSVLRRAFPELNAALGPAIDDGMIEVADAAIAFAHPLLSGVVQARLPDEVRRRLHLMMSELVDDPEQRGRHLAAAALEANARVARSIVEAALEANRRGSPVDAAELMERAAAVTPESDADDRWHRSLHAIELHEEAGHPERAKALVDELLTSNVAGPRRALLLERFGALASSVPSAAIASFAEALQEAGGDAGVASATHVQLAWRMQVTEGTTSISKQHAALAVELAERSGVPALLGQALGVQATIDFFGGRGVQRETLGRARALVTPVTASDVAVHPDHMLAMQLLWADQLDEVRPMLERLVEEADRAERLVIKAVFGTYLVVTYLRLGEFRVAQAWADEMVNLWVQLGAVQGEAPSRWLLADALAHLGDVSSATVEVEAAADPLSEAENWFFQIQNEGTRGFIALSRGDVSETVRILEPLPGRIVSFGVEEPSAFRLVPDLIEALVLSGQLNRGLVLAEQLGESGSELGRSWAVGAAERGGALVASAAGDDDDSLARVEAAVELHRPLKQPFELARSLLAAGIVRRRARKRGAAREALEEARSLFDAMAAVLWREKAGAEIARLGGRPQAAGLTAAETRIASLVATGRSNREIAAELFMTHKTVEWHLSRIYRKLEIRSRTELAMHVASASGHSDDST